MKKTFVVLVCIGLLNAPSSSSAQSSWTNGSGNWSDTTKWSPMVVPGPGTNVYFTNSVAASYTVTNDVLNNSFEDLTVYRAGLLATVYSETDGFNPMGDVYIGSGGRLFISNSIATIGGSVTVSNVGRLLLFEGANVTVNGSLNNAYGVWIQGSNTVLSLLGGGINTAASGYPYLYTAPTDLQFFRNGTLNIGGTNAATANASFVTFTNAGSMTVNGYLNNVGGTALPGTNATVNASTNVVGFYNNGKIENYLGQANGGLVMNATFVNGTNGSVLMGTGGAKFFFERFPVNRGYYEMANYAAATTVNKGDFVNEGRMRMENSTFRVLDGHFINETNGFFGVTSLYAATVQAKSMLNRGTMGITNGYVVPLTITGVLTNQGLISLYRYDYGAFRNTHAGITASNIINSGTILLLGQTNVMPTTQKTIVFHSIASPVTNLASGLITTTNGALMGFHPSFIPRNMGTFLINEDSGIGIGSYATGGTYNDIVHLGLSGYRNEGTVDLHGGTFGVAHLTNAAGATLKGYGDIGYLVGSNLVSGSLLSTNVAWHLTTRSIANQGSIAPSGTLNVGAITNLSGGSIFGYGEITSYNISNYYSGETLITTNIATGARVLNNAGATILASGGTLVLENGLVNNSNAGTLGASNGVLQLGNGTLALTNNGTVYVENGGLHIGAFRNNGTVQIVNSVVTFSNTVVNAGRYISDPSTNTFLEDVTVTASGTLEGGIGDLFDFKKSLLINSTNTGQFNLVLSIVSFTGGGAHTNSITGLDLGGLPYGEMLGYTSTNFAYGGLRLGATDDLYLTDGDGIGSNTNALYIGILDIGGTTNDLARLHTPYNIYYRNGIVGNEYLGGLTYALDGGGFLIAVPEPTTALLLLAAGALLLRKRSVPGAF